MKYWRQIENFGIGNIEKSWIASLFERISELSKENIDDLRFDDQKKDSLRIHDINWNATNIPISRDDLSWIDKEYKDNPAEYPLIQIHISMALGRIVGFWDDASVFQIVLFDPLHNMQPSKRFDYAVKNTAIQRCQYTQLLAKIERAQKKSCDAVNCHVSKELRSISAQMPDHIVSIIRLSETTYKDALAACELFEIDGVANLIKAGIDALERTKSTEENAI